MEKNIARFLKYGTLLSTYGLIATVLLQIFARFFLQNAPAWTEEASRLFFIYAMSFAAGLAFKHHYFVHLDLFYDQLPSWVQGILSVLIPLLTLILFAIMALYAIPFMIDGHGETSPSMKIRMSTAFFSLFIMGISISYFAVLATRKQLKKQGI